MGGAVKAVGNAVSGVVNTITGNNNKGPSAQDVAAATITAQNNAAAAAKANQPNAAPSLSAGQGMGGGAPGMGGGMKQKPGVGANILTSGGLGGVSSNDVATKKLLGS